MLFCCWAWQAIRSTEGSSVEGKLRAHRILGLHQMSLFHRRVTELLLFAGTFPHLPPPEGCRSGLEHQLPRPSYLSSLLTLSPPVDLWLPDCQPPHPHHMCAPCSAQITKHGSNLWPWGGKTGQQECLCTVMSCSVLNYSPTNLEDIVHNLSR